MFSSNDPILFFANSARPTWEGGLGFGFPLSHWYPYRPVRQPASHVPNRLFQSVARLANLYLQPFAPLLRLQGPRNRPIPPALKLSPKPTPTVLIRQDKVRSQRPARQRRDSPAYPSPLSLRQQPGTASPNSKRPTHLLPSRNSLCKPNLHPN